MSKMINNCSSFCKVCFDAKEPEKIYKSHYVKDKVSGKVVCPRLLATECRYCKEKGHTVKFCEKLKKIGNMRERDDRRRSYISRNEIDLNKKSNRILPVEKNVFNTLLIESDDEEDIIEKKESVELSGWAAIAAKPKENVVLKVKENKNLRSMNSEIMIGSMEEATIEEATMEELCPLPIRKVRRVVNWCDEESSSDEEEITDGW